MTTYIELQDSLLSN